MSGRKVVMRYTRALYELAEEKGMLDAIETDFFNMKEILNKVPKVRSYCLRSHHDHIMEMKFVNKAFIPYVSDLTGRMLKAAVRNGRLAAFPYLPQAFKELQDKKAGITEIVIESTREVDENLLKTIETRMEKIIGGTIRICNAIVPKLLGGIRILWNNRMIDLSIAGRLRKMKRLIKAR